MGYNACECSNRNRLLPISTSLTPPGLAGACHRAGQRPDPVGEPDGRLRRASPTSVARPNFSPRATPWVCWQNESKPCKGAFMYPVIAGRIGTPFQGIDAFHSATLDCIPLL
jgi:hypothetical protein